MNFIIKDISKHTVTSLVFYYVRLSIMQNTSDINTWIRKVSALNVGHGTTRFTLVKSNMLVLRFPADQNMPKI